MNQSILYKKWQKYIEKLRFAIFSIKLINTIEYNTEVMKL